MKIVVQRVTRARVVSEPGKEEKIGKGMLLLVGVAVGDTLEDAGRMAAKISKLRIFEDEAGKMNLDILRAGGEILSVPQFTLLGSLEDGNRPAFDGAEEPARAMALWEYFNEVLRGRGLTVKTGSFGKKMCVGLENDGPVTFVLDTAI
ncbi:MAG: D-aminoacyl-tRNA deacylase [Candidatus Omnitrophica bacterium]|nr:D-aminoacyl-tRNA deacylase [Candidatus Omnitrophota bacterium]MDD5487960.1 D-aminoacyl-tRNA deacylase [Candidatus Omnitrophota bacterium]